MTPDFARKYHFWMITDQRIRAYALRCDSQLLALAVEMELTWTNRFAQAAVGEMALEAVGA
jgi:hypothetical protein